MDGVICGINYSLDSWRGSGYSSEIEVMGTEVIAGLIFGMFVIGWWGIFILPLVIGLLQCVRLYFLKRKKIINSKQVSIMKSNGMSSDEIEEIKMLFQDVKKMEMSGIKDYVITFLHSYVTVVVIAVVVKAIKILVF